MNSWNSYQDQQKEICNKYDSVWSPIGEKMRIGISSKLDEDPIHGLRHSSSEKETGWYIWSGEYSEDEDFFEPSCADNLLQIRPEIIKYLGLDAGFRFLIDKAGYEDVWFEQRLIDTE